MLNRILTIIGRWPWLLPALVLGAALAALPFAAELEVDASSDTLLMESDRKLADYRNVRARYGDDAFLILAYAPEGDLLGETARGVITDLSERVGALEHIDTVTSVLDVPLIDSGSDVASGFPERFPRVADVDAAAASEALLNNPFYRDRLVSRDLSTTALRIDFVPDTYYGRLIDRRNALRQRERDGDLSEIGKRELGQVGATLDAWRSVVLERQAATIAAIRDIVSTTALHGEAWLGGLPMITSDMIRFIRRDLVTFGALGAVIVIVLLTAVFRDARYVVLPALCCASTILFLSAVLHFLNWKVTVISVNFLPLLIIVTLSLAVHVVVQIRDRLENSDYRAAVRDASAYVARPCFYTVVTTAVAFASLAASDIRPVVDLGWFMVIGLCLAFVIIFALMPAVLLALPAAASGTLATPGKALLGRVAAFVVAAPRRVLAVCALIVAIALCGVPRLEVENRFIDNFAADTAIHQGMRLIDRKLGGTTPLDVVIGPADDFMAGAGPASGDSADLFRHAGPPSNFWWRGRQIDVAERIERHLAARPAVGKALSIASSARVIADANGGTLPGDFQLAVLKQRATQEISRHLFDPYLSVDGNEARFAARIRESDPELDRNALIDNIHRYLVQELGIADERIRLTGMLVLYNNMLQSLYRSQITTLAAVFATVFLVFVLIFGNLRLAIIAMLPNVFAASLVLGAMGWLGLPLNMMTMTTAAITIGIAVDDTIHYVHQLRHSAPDRSLAQRVNRTHRGVGKAILYTSLAVIAGFGVLAASNFIPSVHFGILAAAGMLTAVIADLVLLPAALVVFATEDTVESSGGPT